MIENDNKLLEIIKKTGFPTELKVGSIFQKNDWYIRHSTYYTDIDNNEEKEREIDVSAVNEREFIVNKKACKIIHHLICEVKKTDNSKPWIIFSTRKNPEEDDLKYVKVRGYGDYSFKLNENETIFSKSRIHRNSLIGKINRIGRSYFVYIKGKNNQNNNKQIISALYSTTKALENYFSGSHPLYQRKEIRNVKYKEYNVILEVIEPVIVLEGPIYEAYINDKGDLALGKVSSTIISFNHLCKTSQNNYLVEVVNLEYLEHFLCLKDEWMTKYLGVFKF